MQNYKNSREPQKYNYREDPANQQVSSAKDEEPNWGGYILHWVAFIVAAGIYIGVWAVDYFAIQRQASYYYKSAKTVSSATDGTPYGDSTLMFTTSDPFDTLGIAVSLIYSWVLWKLPLVVYCYHLI